MSTTTAPVPDRLVHDSTGALDRERAQGIRPIGFARLVRVELRKTIDTRAGLWLLLVVALIAIGSMTAFQTWGPEGDASLRALVDLAAAPLLVLVPIIGTLAATSEWSQRTGLVTFTLEPRRGRVVAAKLVAVVILMVALDAVTLGAAAAIHGIGGGDAWGIPTAVLLGSLLTLVLYVLQGTAFGFALLNTPLAIVASLVLPTVWTLLSILFPVVGRIGVWLDLGRATGPLIGGEMTPTAWAHLATSIGCWVLLPLAIGTWRVLTREVK